LLGRRFGYVTAGEMLDEYFQTDVMRFLVAVIALVFSIPFVGMELAASGEVIQYLTDGVIDRDVAMWVLSAVVFLYVCFGGLRAVAYVGTLQTLLLGAGIAAIGMIAYARLGGIGAFSEAMAKLGGSTIGQWGTNAQGYNAYFEIPGVMQFIAGVDRTASVGGIWTAALILSYSCALMGIQAAPAFTTLAFGTRDMKGFGPQQVWVSAAAAGGILLAFGVVQGMGANFLGGSPVIAAKGLVVARMLPDLTGADTSTVVAAYIRSFSAAAPWFSGLLAICALAAIQVMAAVNISTAGTIFARDFYCRIFNPEADDRLQKLYARIGIALTVLAALAVASYAPSAQSELGALALSFGSQLLPSLVAICWFPWITRQGAVLGLVAGLAAVMLTEHFGEVLTLFFGLRLPWGRWPWTIHSAGWGIFVNFAVCLIVSALTQNSGERQHRMQFHAFLAEYAGPPTRPGTWRPVAWAITLAWAFFALGPGAVVGNDLFGPPNGGIASWYLGIPSLWAWQLAWWMLGILVIWFLAYRMGLSAPPARMVEFYVPRSGPSAASPIYPREQWRVWFWAVVIVAVAITALRWMFG
jgi:Na+/proline symporter